MTYTEHKVHRELKSHILVSMEELKTTQKSYKDIIMLEDVEYYKYIFKKTEKIACAVFHIVRSSQNISQNEEVSNDLECATMDMLNTVLLSLNSTMANIDKEATTLRHALIVFESKLRIAQASRLISVDLLEVFLHEINSVQRSLKKYTEVGLYGLSSSDRGAEENKGIRRSSMRARISRAQDTEAQPSGEHPVFVSRRERIITVLQDKGEASIKDIADVVTDCSEKTIQRELISLIKDNVIMKTGERRWSKYSLL